MILTTQLHRNIYLLFRSVKLSVSFTLNANTNRIISFDSSILNEHKISFLSCGKVYEKWRKEKKFRKIPEEALKFSTVYIDTHMNVNFYDHKPPIVVSLHGAPGSCQDFSGLIPYLHEKGARVIAPTFPNFSSFAPGVFRHSAEEKAEFIKDFLKTISVSQVDLLICHSSSIYPGLELCLSKDVNIKSLVMLNTATLHFKMRATPPVKFLTLFVRASEIPILLKLMKLLLPTVMKVFKIPIRIENSLDPLLSLSVMAHGNIPQSKEKFIQLSKNKFPILFIFSENDKVIDSEYSYELANLLGATELDAYKYDQDGILKQEGKETQTLKVLSFEYGSHYVLWKYPNIVHNEISNFLYKNKI